MFTADNITDYDVFSLRESVRDGTPLTSNHEVWTLCTNLLSIFRERSWNPSVWNDPYSVTARARCAELLNARAKAQP